MGLRFGVVVPTVDERPEPHEAPERLVARLSLAKARTVARAGRLVIAADTVVVLDGQVLGKPADAAEAGEMLTRLQGRRHQVYSGLAAVANGNRACVQVASTPVQMAPLQPEQVLAYVATGDPLDKAGAYAIQHPLLTNVVTVAGCYANVVGLPMCHLYRLLDAWGYPVPTHPLHCCPLAVQSGCPWSSAITSCPPERWCASW